MLEIEIPGRGPIQIRNFLLDYNGTIGLDGKPIPGVKSRLNRLKKQVVIHLVSADTQGTLQKLGKTWMGSVRFIVTKPENEDLQKFHILEKLGKSHTVMIGNGTNDSLALKASVVGIGVVGREGASTEALRNADLIVSDINDALDLFLYPKRLIASLRK